MFKVYETIQVTRMVELAQGQQQWTNGVESGTAAISVHSVVSHRKGKCLVQSVWCWSMKGGGVMDQG